MTNSGNFRLMYLHLAKVCQIQSVENLRINFCARSRHERDQSFLIPVPVRKKISSRSLQKQISVPVPSRKPFDHGPGPKKTFWSRPCSEKIWVLDLVRKNILVAVPVKKESLVPVPPGPLCSCLARREILLKCFHD